jgi:hypothetical protein
MGITWELHGNYIGITWELQGNYMGIHKNYMEITWGYMGITWELQGNFMVRDTSELHGNTQEYMGIGCDSGGMGAHAVGARGERRGGSGFASLLGTKSSGTKQDRTKQAREKEKGREGKQTPAREDKRTTPRETQTPQAQRRL